MSPRTWSDAELDRHRMSGDPAVDQLVEQLLGTRGDSSAESFGRLGYNHLLNLTESMLEYPELLFARGSALHQQIEKVPRPFLEYFLPEPAPDWVDTRKVQIGATLWSKLTLPIFLTLYIRSLPTCYMVRTGIAALYETGKLRDQNYISQRLYETSMFLDAVMREGTGLRVVEDLGPHSDTHLAETLNAMDPTGGWRWEGRRLVRSADRETDFTSDEIRRISEQLEARKQSSPPRRFLWGIGYVNAKKVRFLHASLRYMLLHPDRFPTFAAKRPEDGKFDTLAEVLHNSIQPWDVAARGIPISQDQQAFALMTFGITILEGLDRWGFATTAEERDGYLHLWKVVGHVLGVHEDLLSDDPEECRELMRRLMQRDGGSTENGMALTDALIVWLKDYLPPRLGMDEYFASYLIKWQMGEQASLVMLPATLRKCGFSWRQVLFHSGIALLGVYAHARSFWLEHFGGTEGLSRRVHDASLFIMDSLRGAYDRRPFYLPVNPTQWTRSYGATPEFILRLRRWRRTMFDLLAVGVIAAVLSRILLAVSIVLLLVQTWMPSLVIGTTALVLELLSRWVLDRKLPARFVDRPTIGDRDRVRRRVSVSDGDTIV